MGSIIEAVFEVILEGLFRILPWWVTLIIVMAVIAAVVYFYTGPH